MYSPWLLVRLTNSNPKTRLRCIFRTSARDAMYYDVISVSVRVIILGLRVLVQLMNLILKLILKL